MKNLFIPLMTGLLLTLAVSCQKEETQAEKTPGTLSLSIDFAIQVNEFMPGLKSGTETGDFKVSIFSESGEEVSSFERFSEMPALIELMPGNYYVVADSDNDFPAEFENPYYLGISDIFTIQSNMQENVMVLCKLANTIVSVVYPETLTTGFLDISTTVSSEAGSLVYLWDEIRPGYFRTLPLEILVELSFMNSEGLQSSRTLSGSIPDPKPGRHYEIIVNASPDKGTGSIQLILDDTEIPVEIIEIHDDTETETEPDETGPAPDDGETGYGEILITEIMFDPDNLSDAVGEWFEIYNNSSRALNLEGIILERAGTSGHAIASQIELLPGEYFVMARTVDAVDVLNRYIYGTAFLLPNNGAVLSLINPSTDAGPGALIFSVNYGGPGFPNTPGVSISLNPNMMNAADAILGASWCNSTSVYNTGDRGTPGRANDSCD